jgi:hypothetical protein
MKTDRSSASQQPMIATDTPSSQWCPVELPSKEVGRTGPATRSADFIFGQQAAGSRQQAAGSRQQAAGSEIVDLSAAPLLSF